MRLIRGWEERYSPGKTGGLQLSKATVYGAIGEEDGLGDRREGEVRARWDEGHLAVNWESSDRLPGAVRSISEDYHGSDPETEAFRRAFAEMDDDPDLALHRIGPGEWSTSQNLVVSGKGIESPYLFCLSREPTTKSAWEKLRAALPERYDTWTVTEDVDAVQFEIECGIKRWLASQRITRHAIVRANGWVTYPYELAPPSGDPAEVFRIARWFRKRTKYQDQAEYRFAWILSSDELEDMPEKMVVELTRTGLTQFKPWMPPSD